MAVIIPKLFPVFTLILLGAILGRRGFISEAFVEGAKRLVASVSLPVLLFIAFSRLNLQSSHLFLALAVFASTGILAIVSLPFAAILRLPQPDTRLLFQGFEAGMLGYALFASLFGNTELGYFASADLGQVFYVFTVLMVQLQKEERDTIITTSELARRLVSSPVIVAITAGLISSAMVPGAENLPWGARGILDPSLSALGSLTTPLVGLVVGFGLRRGIEGGGKGLTQALLAVLGRITAAAGLGLLVAFVLVPALGFNRMQSIAVLILFVMPPPFIITVFYKRSEALTYISSVLTIHTLFSLVAVLMITIFLGVTL